MGSHDLSMVKKPKPPSLPTIVKQVQAALDEDIGKLDVSAAAVPPERMCSAAIYSHSAGIVCGKPWVEETLACVDPTIKIEWFVNDSDCMAPQQQLCLIHGHCKELLSAERSALNFLQTLSATATTTAAFVQRIRDIKPPVKAKIFDTRKTIPGLREAQKYAVACGGGCNHRHGLYDGILLKENHLLAYGNLTGAVQALRQQCPKQTIEVEVENLAEVKAALRAKADIILLDNFSLDAINETMHTIKAHATSHVCVEVSGNISLDNVVAIAKTGVQRISIGALTKNVCVPDLSLRFLTVT